MTVYKCYGIIIRDNVQNIGFRELIEDIARSNFLEGYIFNAEDGSVKAVIRGEDCAIENFLEETKIKGSSKGIHLDVTEKIDLGIAGLKIPLPSKFSRMMTDDIKEIGIKLDIGNKRLDSIDGKLSILVDGQNKMLVVLEKLVDGQNKLVDGQNKMLKILEEKL